MATPGYQGPNQLRADGIGSWFGRLAAFFGGGTPAYQGDGQPSPSGAYLGGGTPAYLPAPTASTPDVPTETEATMTCPIDPEEIAAGKIAIVIPRGPVSSQP